MPAGQLYINGQDAYTTWGVSLSDTAIANLMAPVPMKEDIVNESRLEHGRRHMTSENKVQERELNLPVHIVANNKADYLDKLYTFRMMLEGVAMDIITAHEPSVVYHCRYVSCTQFSQFLNGIAKLMLRLVEPNPNDRT